MSWPSTGPAVADAERLEELTRQPRRRRSARQPDEEIREMVGA